MSEEIKPNKKATKPIRDLFIVGFLILLLFPIFHLYLNKSSKFYGSLIVKVCHIEYPVEVREICFETFSHDCKKSKHSSTACKNLRSKKSPWFR